MAYGKKTGGRIQGTPNKPKPYMQALETILEAYVNQPNKDGVSAFTKDFLSLEPNQRLLIAEKFLNYCKPKKQAIQADLTSNADITIEAKLNEMM